MRREKFDQFDIPICELEYAMPPEFLVGTKNYYGWILADSRYFELLREANFIGETSLILQVNLVEAKDGLDGLCRWVVVTPGWHKSVVNIGGKIGVGRHPAMGSDWRDNLERAMNDWTLIEYNNGNIRERVHCRMDYYVPDKKTSKTQGKARVEEPPSMF